MQDEAPDGQPQDVGDAVEGHAEPAWWPWPEPQAEEPTGPRDGAPGPDETLSLPVAAETGSMSPEPEPVGATGAVLDAGPEPESARPPAPAPEPEPAAEATPEPEPEPAAEAPPEPEPRAGPSRRRAPAVVAERPLDATPSPEPIPATGAVALSAAGGRTGGHRCPERGHPRRPPEAGTGPIGSIPAAHARAVWSRVQASNWRLFLIRFLCAGLAVVATVAIVPGLGFVGWSWGQFTRIAIIFGLLNATVKPLLQFLVLRFIFSTYGIVVVIINTLLLLLLAAILDDTFAVYRPLSLVVGGLVVGIVGLILETLLGATPPVLDRDYKERNGLR